MKDTEKIDSQEKPFKEKRKLAAIMFTDIQGFTRLMAKDEPTTIKILEEQTRIMKDLINQYEGRLVKTIGDAVMADFKSAVSAVRCGIEIQKEIRKYHANRPDAEKLLVRIGIHIGDVLVRGEDIYGHGVNVASRIEALAGPGCICVSKDVHNRIKNFPDIKSISVGLKKLKNVEEPLEIYNVVAEGILSAETVKKVVAEPSNSIAVLPFVDMSPQKDQEYFCDGMTEEIINTLTKLESLRVVARTSAFAFKGKHEDIREVGRKLNVNTLLEGSVRKAGNRLRITAQLVKVDDGYHIWSEKYDRDMEDIFAIQDEISLAIAGKLKLRLLGGEKEKLIRRHTDNLEAYNLYMRGRYLWNKRSEGNLKKAIEYFTQAIERDSTYALAYVGIAESYIALPDYSTFPPVEAFPKAKAAALKALQIDNTLGEAHATLALVKRYHEWDTTEAEKEFKRAIELNPNYATAHHWYALYLRQMARFDEALAEITMSQQLDPLSLIINLAVGSILYDARQYDQAIAQYRKVLEMEPNFVAARACLGEAYFRKSMFEEALAEHQTAKDLVESWIPGIELMLGLIYERMGKKGALKEALGQTIERSKDEYVSPYLVALFYLSIGDKDQGFEWLEKAYEERDHTLLNLKVEPAFDDVRSDPRFVALLKKVGLGK